MPLLKQGPSTYLRVIEILYLGMFVFSFYLLLISRTGEAHTVWEVLNPLFIPALLVTTFLLLTIVFASEKVALKLLFIIVYSILVHSFFPIIFPAGDLSGQQIALGRTRLVFDNVALHGWAPWPMTIQAQLYEWFQGLTFQAALSVIFARMLSVDLFWVHLFLVPVLWGVFVPIAVFLVTKVLGRKEEVAVLASLLISAFPYATYFGAISAPNSLGFIFFFYSLYFILKNLGSNDSKTKVLIVAFCFLSFISHFLAGVMSFSLLVLALTFKSCESEKTGLPITSKVSLAISFIFCVSLLPLSLIYLRLFLPGINTVFTLAKFYELPFREVLGLSLLGGLIYGFDLKTIILIVIGPALALLCMIYLVYSLRKSPTKSRIHILFFFAAFLVILIDFRILKLFMEGLPLGEERLWVFRDFIATPFVALAIYAVVSWLKRFLKTTPPLTSSVVSSLKALSKRNILRVSSLLFTLNVLIPVILGGWITFSLYAAYPQVAPVQTTWYELKAVKYIDENTKEKYVVIGDVWTIYAGEMIAGVNNPRAYYFLETNKTGHDLFVNMREDPSPQWMLLAMNYTHTEVAYFIVTKLRIGTEQFQNVTSHALANQQLTVVSIPNVPSEKLYVFSYRKEENA